MKTKIAIIDHASVSPLGMKADEIWESSCGTKSKISSMEFDGNSFPVAQLHPHAELEIQKLKTSQRQFNNLDRTTLIGILAAKSLNKDLLKDLKLAIHIGSSRGATGTLEKLHSTYLDEKSVPPYTSPVTTLGNIASHIRSQLGADAYEATHSVTCSTGLQSIANGMAWLKSGMADVFVCGATEAPLTGFTLAQMNTLKIYSTDSLTDYPCRPLELIKNTMVLGEGAVLFTLMPFNKIKDSVQPLAIIESFGYGSEHAGSLTGISLKGEAFIKSMTMALKGMDNKQLPDVVIMHAPGTLKGDKAELEAVRKVFGRRLPALFSNKWLCGHTLGTSGTLSLEAAIFMLKNKNVPEMPYLKNQPSPPKIIRKVMINASGFGGNAASIIISL